MTENNRILIIDDDPGVRDSYKEILFPVPKEEVLQKGALLFGEPGQQHEEIERQQYDLTFAEKGEEGVEAVKKAIEEKSPLALAFIDMKMYGIDGAETSKRIWAIDPDIKIVIVTAYSEYTPDDIIRVTGRDDIFYLRKPFNPEEIRQFARVLTNEWNLERERKSLCMSSKGFGQIRHKNKRGFQISNTFFRSFKQPLKSSYTSYVASLYFS